MSRTAGAGAGEVWVVAGSPGAGKSTVAELLLETVRPVPALLDKDILFSGLAGGILAAHGRPAGEREGPWYDRHVKIHEYRALTEAAHRIRSAGCPVLLVAPFTEQIRDPARWRDWTAALGGDPVRLLWVRSDAATLHARLTARGSGQDTGKLAAFDAFIARTRPDEPPPAPHHELDNRLGAPPLHTQLTSLLGPA